MQLATLKFYVHRADLKCKNGAYVIVEGTWHADSTVPLDAPKNVCMQARYWLAKLQET